MKKIKYNCKQRDLRESIFTTIMKKNDGNHLNVKLMHIGIKEKEKLVKIVR